MFNIKLLCPIRQARLIINAHMSIPPGDNEEDPIIPRCMPKAVGRKIKRFAGKQQTIAA